MARFAAKYYKYINMSNVIDSIGIYTSYTELLAKFINLYRQEYLYKFVNKN